MRAASRELRRICRCARAVGGLTVQGLAALHLEAFRLAAQPKPAPLAIILGLTYLPRSLEPDPHFSASSAHFPQRLASPASLSTILQLPASTPAPALPSPRTPTTFNLDGAATEIPAPLILHPVQPIRGLISPAQLPPASIATAQPHLRTPAKQRLTPKTPHYPARLPPPWFPHGNGQP